MAGRVIWVFKPGVAGVGVDLGNTVAGFADVGRRAVASARDGDG